MTSSFDLLMLPFSDVGINGAHSFSGSAFKRLFRVSFSWAVKLPSVNLSLVVEQEVIGKIDPQHMRNHV